MRVMMGTRVATCGTMGHEHSWEAACRITHVQLDSVVHIQPTGSSNLGSARKVSSAVRSSQSRKGNAAQLHVLGTHGSMHQQICASANVAILAH